MCGFPSPQERAATATLLTVLVAHLQAPLGAGVPAGICPIPPCSIVFEVSIESMAVTSFVIIEVACLELIKGMRTRLIAMSVSNNFVISMLVSSGPKGMHEG